MNIDNLTAEQIISLALFKGTTDLLKFMDFDAVDWLEWSWINRN